MREDERGAAGARELLHSLPLHTLLTLCNTVTHGLVSARTHHEAVKAIILHSTDLESILRRKAMTRDMLFQYLHQKSVSVTPATVKQDLIGKILSHWLRDDPTAQIQDAVTSTEIQNRCLGTEDQLQTMGQNFVEWFYPLLKQRGLSVDNFWENSEVLLNMIAGSGECETTVFTGVAQVLSAFARLVCGFGVILAPSVAGGLTAEMDQHGLVLITCSGTVHQRSTCVGVFQQSFALTSDPFSQGDWRIKRSKLDVRLEVTGLSLQGTASAIEGS